MDELEFRRRVYANPQQIDQESLAAARKNPALQKILEQTQNLDAELISLTNSIETPAGLADRLQAIPDRGNSVSHPASRRTSNNFLQYYAVAASLLLAVGIGGALFLGGGTSSNDMAFGSEVMQHLYHEVTEIDAINSGTELSVVAMPAVTQVMALAETQFSNEEFLRTTPVRFAKPCDILPAYHSAHLMVLGSQGAISVIIINNSPVTREFTIQDDRFDGVVIPLNSGNLILIGEKDENLDRYKAMFSENVEWLI